MAELSRKLKKYLADGMPEADQLEKELERELKKSGFTTGIRRILFLLVLLVAMAAIASVFRYPVVQIYGRSMNPTFDHGEIVVASREKIPEAGDVIAFAYNSGLLVKRVIAVGGDTVEIREDGTVLINGEPKTELYIKERVKGETDLEYPFTVPEDRYFVMGDNRGASVDSRNTAVGCVPAEQVTGTIVYRIWPLSKFGDTWVEK